MEFIQGPNRENQKVLYLSEFVSLSNDILMLDYNRKKKKKDKGESGDDYVLKSSLKTNTSRSMSKSRSLHGYDLEAINNQIVTKPSKNYMISLVKYRILNILNHLLDGFEPDHYVYFLYRRELNPECFRKTFAYQKYYFDKYYKSVYTKEVFFNHTQDTDKDEPIPCIMEIGFMCFYILKKLQPNIYEDPDERYQSQIMKLIPKKPKPTSDKNPNVLTGTWLFMCDISRSIYRTFKPKTSQVIKEELTRIQNSDSEIK